MEKLDGGNAFVGFRANIACLCVLHTFVSRFYAIKIARLPKLFQSSMLRKWCSVSHRQSMACYPV
jgi:hypothetical protein